MNIDGIWRGEFVIVQQNMEAKAIPVPFVLRIQSQSQRQLISDSCVFSGICQDDPVISKIALHASVQGSLEHGYISFVKQYPMLIVQNAGGGVDTYDETHPEIFYYGKRQDVKFAGTWRMYRTFRKIHGRVSELKGMHGTW